VAREEEVIKILLQSSLVLHVRIFHPMSLLSRHGVLDILKSRNMVGEGEGGNALILAAF